ncbi:MAG: addiction module protein [Verrucomicrobia bacterium]|nr:addiction module protein [Verrucomicrobiota bacterium]
MSTTHLDQLTGELLTLPGQERAQLAEALWGSLEEADLPAADFADMADAKRRAQELDNGTVQGRPHAEVMARVRAALSCAR